ncbi:MAG TPA: hypothetical protein VIJ20_14320 [Solirubrobacteraceae bacterium]
MTKTLDESAQRIADRGREALLERLRGAFEEAAAAHADVLELDADMLERMIHRAVDRADGLQWRRALATVATEELDIGLGEALGHPAVARAQEIVGAPSYEEGLAAIAQGKPPAPGESAPEGAGPDAGSEKAGGGAEAEAEATDPARDEPQAMEIRVGVVHLEGLPEVEGKGDLKLLFAEDRLDVLRASDELVLMSFAWSELRRLEVQPGRARMLRRRAARVVLTAGRRRGSFEARGVDPEELGQRLGPALAKVDAEA